MADEFMRTVKQLREQTSSSKEGNVDSLHFPVPNSRKQYLNFTPQRKGREVVAATQEDEDMESDSLSSHSSRRRKRLFAPWKLVLVKLKSKSTKLEVMQEFAEIAENDLLKSGFSDEARQSVDSLGGFKPAQVMIDKIRIM